MLLYLYLISLASISGFWLGYMTGGKFDAFICIIGLTLSCIYLGVVIGRSRA